MTESQMDEIGTAIVQLSKFIQAGPNCTLDDLFDLSGLLHFIGCRLGALAVERPDDQHLIELLEQCADLQVRTIEQTQAMAELQRGASVH